MDTALKRQAHRAASLLHGARVTCWALLTHAPWRGCRLSSRGAGGRGRTSPVDRADLGERQPDALRVLGRRPLLQDVLALQGVDLPGPERPSYLQRRACAPRGHTAGRNTTMASHGAQVGQLCGRPDRPAVAAWSCSWALAQPGQPSLTLELKAGTPRGGGPRAAPACWGCCWPSSRTSP